MPKAVRTGAPMERMATSPIYDIIPEGTYVAIIRKLAWSQFTTKAGVTMEKLTPEFEILNVNKTRIDRQDFTIGAVNKAGEYTSEFWGDGTTSPIFAGYELNKGNYGARQLMFTLGMLNEDGVAIFNEDAILDVVVSVDVRTRTYEYKGVNRQQNAIIRVGAITPQDFDDLYLPPATDVRDWVSYTVCVREADGARDPEFQTITFASQAAFEHWYDKFYNDEDWENPVGILEPEHPNVGLVYWEDALGGTPEVAQDATPETQDLPM